MTSYRIKIQLLSPALIGAGEGHGATIDGDSVFDSHGLPMIPAKRVKGWLLDASRDFLALADAAGIDSTAWQNLDEIFGKRGSMKSSFARFGNFYLADHEQMRQWLVYLNQEKNNKFKPLQNLFNRQAIVEAASCRMQNIAIDSDGVTRDHTLRTVRMVEDDHTFIGNISFRKASDDFEFLLYVACKLLRRIGGNRNRGSGEVTCSLWADDKKIDRTEDLEGICIG